MQVLNYFTSGSGRQLFKNIYLGLMRFYFSFFDHRPTNEQCIVFAPHQDDETLGCGGTIIQKIRKGASVKVVFMTDGNNSHKHIGDYDLKEVRREEALAACKVLGIDSDNVIFLDQTDGKLSDSFDVAVDKVVGILEASKPNEVYVPYIRDHHPDHKATNNIVLGAVRKVGARTMIYEYPTWFWDHWPVVEVKIKRKKEFLSHLKTSFISAYSVLRELRCSVRITNVIDVKRNALDKHKSQITRINDDEKWFVLGDVSQGEWLDSFFRDREVFHKYACP